MALFAGGADRRAGRDDGDRGRRRRAQCLADGDRARRALRPVAAAPAARPRRPRQRRRASACCSTARRCPIPRKARLKAMLETDDGFEIARRDLEIRGPGEFLGARQSGAPLLRFADPLLDEALLLEARARRRAAARQRPAGGRAPCRALARRPGPFSEGLKGLRPRRDGHHAHPPGTRGWGSVRRRWTTASKERSPSLCPGRCGRASPKRRRPLPILGHDPAASLASRVRAAVRVRRRRGRQPERCHGRQRQGRRLDQRQDAHRHQRARRHHQLAGLLDRARRVDPLHPAEREQRRPQPRGRPGPVEPARPAAVQRPRLPDQPERHRLRRRRTDRRRRPGRLDARPRRCRLPVRPAALRRPGLGRHADPARADQHRGRRPGAADRAPAREQRRHHLAPGRDPACRRPQRAARRHRQPGPAGDRLGAGGRSARTSAS